MSTERQGTRKFELDWLGSYDDDALIAEIRRVAELIPEGRLTHPAFDLYSKASSHTISRRFGSWRKALAAAGLEHRYDNSQDAISKEFIIEALQSVARQKNTSTVSKRELWELKRISYAPIRRLFGSYANALKAAGLSLHKRPYRFSNEDCFENLLTMWTILGRQPYLSEMVRPPSRIKAVVYTKRWGSWRKALEAFIEYANKDAAIQAESVQTQPPEPLSGPSAANTTDSQKPYDKEPPAKPTKRTARNIPLGLRYTVLIRDRARCCLCGKSPATDLTTRIHVDHIVPWSRGGETRLDNLRVLCEACNLGKGGREEPT